ncbi:hypothetical protein BJV82DRAFT_491512, partial [Fennellomyces sp. T-0311]
HTSPSPTATGESPATLWSQFRSHSLQFHARNHERMTMKIFEDTDAKAAQRQQKMERLWIRSAEKNSVVFDLRRHTCTGTAFLDALHDQFPEAIGVESRRGDHNGVAIVAFDSSTARTKACTVGVTISDSLTIVGNATVDVDSQVHRLNLERLPLLRANELGPLITRALSPYGTVLHVNMYTDERGLFFGKGSTIIDLASTENKTFKPLTAKIPLGDDRLFYTNWKGMPKKCFFCDQEGHLRAACPTRRRGPKLCFACQSDGHLIADCPKVNNSQVGNKRLHME